MKTLPGWFTIPAATVERDRPRALPPVAWMALVLAAGGCKLPDLSPFAEATASVHTATVEAGSIVVEDLEHLARLETEDPEFEGYPVRFRQEWQERLALMGDLVGYSDALAAVVSSAGQFGENASSLADSVSSLLGAAGLDPAAVLPAAAVQTVVSAGEAIVTVKAQRDLAVAVELADPGIQEVARLVDEDLAEILDDLLAANGVWADIEAGIKRKYVRERGVDLAYRELLVSLRGQVEGALAMEAGEIKAHRAATQGLRASAIRDRLTVRELEGLPDPTDDDTEKLQTAKAALEGYPAEIEALEVLIQEHEAALAEDRETLEEVEGWIEETDGWFGDLSAELDALSEDFGRQRAAIVAARQAVREWASIHAGLARSLRDDRAPDIDLIVSKAKEIRGILEE